jgi:hypothetical protein
MKTAGRLAVPATQRVISISQRIENAANLVPVSQFGTAEWQLAIS